MQNACCLRDLQSFMTRPKLFETAHDRSGRDAEHGQRRQRCILPDDSPKAASILDRRWCKGGYLPRWSSGCSQAGAPYLACNMFLSFRKLCLPNFQDQHSRMTANGCGPQGLVVKARQTPHCFERLLYRSLPGMCCRRSRMGFSVAATVTSSAKSASKVFLSQVADGIILESDHCSSQSQMS